MTTTNMKHLHKALVLMRRASENEKFSLQTREMFREIEHELWLAAGRPADNEVRGL